ncbi:MAG: alanine racemase [Firmicutes bacterium]|nr:alanine racemase [Bacillota bacterium]
MKKLIIEKDKLRQNIGIIKSMSRSKIIAVLKGNGYGLGMLEFAKFLQENGIDLFAVSEIKDAVCLAENGFSGKVLLLTPTSIEDEALLIVKSKIIPSVGSITSALTLNDTGLKLNEIVDFHLKIDIGFGRFGFLPNEISEACTFLQTMQNIRVAGTYSHFSFSFSRKEKDVYSQYNRFINAVELIRQKGLDPGMLHICNSSAFLRFPQMHLDAVRIGSAFLGRIPIENTYKLQKIGYLKSRIIEAKELPKNHNIGYANTYKTRKATRIGIIPVGYLDGFGVEKSRDTFRLIDILRYIYNDIKSLNRKIYVNIGDKYARVLGRIGTYNIVVDLTGINANVGDEVILDVNPMLVGSHIERKYI